MGLNEGTLRGNVMAKRHASRTNHDASASQVHANRAPQARATLGMYLRDSARRDSRRDLLMVAFGGVVILALVSMFFYSCSRGISYFTAGTFGAVIGFVATIVLVQLGGTRFSGEEAHRV